MVHYFMGIVRAMGGHFKHLLHCRLVNDIVHRIKRITEKYLKNYLLLVLSNREGSYTPIIF